MRNQNEERARGKVLPSRHLLQPIDGEILDSPGVEEGAFRLTLVAALVSSTTTATVLSFSLPASSIEEHHQKAPHLRFGITRQAPTGRKSVEPTRARDRPLSVRREVGGKRRGEAARFGVGSEGAGEAANRHGNVASVRESRTGSR
jgi:hypothetical protein